MKRHALIVALLCWFMLLFATTSYALTIPASEDSFTAPRNTLSYSTNNANSLIVDATRKSYLYFDLSDIPQDAVVRWAKLRLFLPTVRTPGAGLSVHLVTGTWNESTRLADVPSIVAGSLGMIPSDKMASRRFVTVDVKDTVQKWINGGTLNEGFAIQPIVKAGSPTASVMLTSKEGPVFGLPAELDIEFQPEGGANKPVALDQLPSAIQSLLIPTPPTLTSESQLPQSVRSLLGSLSSAFTPKITSQPSLSGGLSVSAENSLDPQIKYQWLRNGLPISTGTESSLRRAGLAGGTYQVRASNTVSGTNSVSVVIPDNGHEVVFVPNTGVLFSKYETTVGQWKAFVEETGWNKSDAWRIPANEGQTDFIQDDFHPVIKVSWDDSTDYCQWLSRKTGKLFRLPSESEWMTAVPTEYPWGTSFPPSASKGNYAMDAEGRRDWPRGGIDGFKFTAPVGTFSPDHRGLFDIGGNVWEWLKDNVVDGGASRKMFTGGSWNDVPSDSSSPSDVSSNRRGIESASFKNNNVGFRIVRDWLNEGLVAYYPFNGNATDDSGNGLNGRFHGSPSLGTDRFGGQSGYTYPNAGDVVILPIDHSKFETDFTISVWVQPTARNHDYAQILSGENSFFQLHLYGPVYDSNGSGWFGKAGFYQYNKSLGRYYRTLNSQNQIGVGGWSHILVTVSGDQSRFYLNGVLKDSGSQSFEFAGVTGNSLYLGGNSGYADAENFRWEGAIDDVRIYNRALSEQEVITLYFHEKPETSTYQFVQGSFTWHQAKADAESMGGHLGVITSQEEWTNIKAQLGANAGKSMWIGAFQESGASSVTSGWKWVTEEPFDYNSWEQGEPNGGLTGFVNVNHWNAPYASGLWNDTAFSDGIVEGYLLEIETNARDLIPTIVTQPSVSTDGTKISVQAAGAGTLTYQWRLNGVAIAGGTSSQLATQGLQSGTYTVLVSNGFASVTSASIQHAPSPIGNFALVTGGTLPATSQLGALAVDTFYIGKTEVTWGEWQTVRTWAVANGYTDLANVGQGVGDSYPVTHVNWFDVVKWCNARSEKEGKIPVYKNGTDVYRTGDVSEPAIVASANGYRLPSEKEWEFAARGGTQTQGYTYSGSNDLNAVGWYDGWSSGNVLHEVGKKLANELGIHDLSGNLFEWTGSWHPSEVGLSRMIRGGNWYDGAEFCAVAFRDIRNAPVNRYYYFGFRVATSGEYALGITAQPSISLDGTKLGVEAAGVGTLTYQWRFNGVAIAGGTSSQLSTQGLQSGTYTVIVGNGFASLTSSAIQYPSPIGAFALVTGGTLPASSELGAVPVDTFYIGKTEVTWGEWQTVRTWAVANGYTDLDGVGQGVGDNYPVSNVSWYDVVKWCNARSEKEGKVPAYKNGTNVYRTGNVDPQVVSFANGYRLPSQKEWEFAAIGGTQTNGYAYSGSSDLNSVGWYVGNSGGTTNEVAKKLASELGIFDMSGNLSEWIGDGYGAEPRAYRSRRGGHWNDTSEGCVIPHIAGNYPDEGGEGNGFRVATSGEYAIGITAQPSVSLDGTKLSVEAAGAGTLTYQWRLNGAAIAGGTSSQLSTQGLQSGTYTVVVSNGLASLTSSAIQYPSPIGNFALVTGGTLPATSQLGALPVDTFYIGKTEVTWGEWQTVRTWAVANGYTDLANVGQGVGDSYPVTSVNWFDAVKWCNARSEKEGKTPVYKNGTVVYRTGDVLEPAIVASVNGYRLPSEKEWEFAARGGTQTQGYTYSGSNDLNAVGWDGVNSGGAVKEVGKKQANELGIYDMSGNLWEWSGSWYPGLEGSYRVFRGGNWYFNAEDCTVAERDYHFPEYRSSYNGFRVALSAAP